MSKASEKLLEVVAFMPDSWHHYPPYNKTKYGPGQAYEKLSQETKDILKELKSDDIKNAPWWLAGSRSDHRKQQQKEDLSQLKLAFDAKIEKPNYV